jgi:hypothetical protein
MKFHGAAGYLDLEFNSGAGNATWTTVSPFNYQLHCPGIDHPRAGISFTISISTCRRNQSRTVPLL